MAEAIYFYIDGGYIRQKYAEAMKRVFGVDGAEPDISTLQMWCYGKRFGNAVPQRFFYYDCLHDIKKDSETDDDFKKRLARQNGVFESVQSLSGFHVRLGSLTGSGKKIRQKKVDVLLAVEMLDHAFRKNMVAAFLLAGDGDFTPVAEAVVRLGTWVEVYYDQHSASKELYSTADRGMPLTFNDLWSWSSSEFRVRYPIPIHQEYGPEVSPTKHAKTGKNSDGETVIIVERGDKAGAFVLYVNARRGLTFFTHDSADVLEKYYAEQYGAVTWDKK